MSRNFDITVLKGSVSPDFIGLKGGFNWISIDKETRPNYSKPANRAVIIPITH